MTKILNVAAATALLVVVSAVSTTARAGTLEEDWRNEGYFWATARLCNQPKLEKDLRQTAASDYLMKHADGKTRPDLAEAGLREYLHSEAGKDQQCATSVGQLRELVTVRQKNAQLAQDIAVNLKRCGRTRCN